VVDRLGSSLDRIVFRAGRVDAVYGLALSDARAVVLKVHRPPVKLAHLAATVAGLRHLNARGYPCPEPLDGPVLIDGRTVTVESLLADGTVEDARRPPIRQAMAVSLAEQVELLAEVPGGTGALASRLGPGPAWTRYAGGPWPEPHDPVFDFSTSPAGWEWLDDYAREATADLVRLRGTSERVIGHADWYAGNLRFADDRVVAAFDWQLFAEHEAVIVGLSAGGYLGAEAPSPADVAHYLADYHCARSLSDEGWCAAAAAARWMLAFNARCGLALLDGTPAPDSPLHRLSTARSDYRLLNR
jgi:Ser/Thr protein kinase RdoA (MazF antagonist)